MYQQRQQHASQFSSACAGRRPSAVAVAPGTLKSVLPGHCRCLGAAAVSMRMCAAVPCCSILHVFHLLVRTSWLKSWWGVWLVGKIDAHMLSSTCGVWWSGCCVLRATLHSFAAAHMLKSEAGRTADAGTAVCIG
jgi:hypothetical protein